MASVAIEAMNLYFSYGKHDALKGVSFKVPEGSITALIGPNGAGKTTTLFIVMGLLKPKKGGVKLFDIEIGGNQVNLRGKIGFVYEQPRFYRHLTMKQNLILMGELYGIGRLEVENRIDYLSSRLNLKGYLDSKPDTLSHGYRQRFAIAEALLPNPELLILDEPTSGIDPETLAILHRFLIELNSKYKTTILISSHNLYLLEKTAKYFIFMKDGRIVAEGWREKLISNHSEYGNQYIIGVENLPDLLRRAIDKKFKIFEWMENNEFIVEIDPEELDILLKFFLKNKIIIKHIRKRETDLEELYLRLCSDYDE